MFPTRPTQSLLLISCLLLASLTAHAQTRNASAVLPSVDVFAPVNVAQFPNSVFFADTGIAVRYVTMLATSLWNSVVMCDPERRALNFWGEPERLSLELCTKPDTFAELYAYSFLRTVEREYPEVTTLYSQLMRDNGFDPEDRSTDKNTAVGMGNAIGYRAADWWAKDGWNSLGDLSRNHFKMPFEDHTGYTPVNSPWELKHPLRWQPLQDGGDFRVGRYTYQNHVVPQLGGVRPFLLTKEETDARRVEDPYVNINATELSGEDAEKMDALVKEVWKASRESTPEQRYLARWWDNKYISVGSFGGFYLEDFGLVDAYPMYISRWLLGEMVAQHDAMILAWKEKRRVDAVRPKTITNHFYGDKGFVVYSDREKMVTSVLGKDWEPLVPTQPHSEYPSASACLCTAAADHATLILREELDRRGIAEETPYKVDFEVNSQLIPPDGLKSIEFKTVKDAGRSCGMSRLWAGVHFSPSIPAGEKLAEGVGMRAYQMMKDFAEGRVPKNCWWCSSDP